jgi:CO/xanthine dehydrogenase Mo-binding subunit
MTATFRGRREDHRLVTGTGEYADDLRIPATAHAPALAAVTNAVLDALAEFGVREIDMPLTPARIWHAIAAAKADG